MCSLCLLLQSECSLFVVKQTVVFFGSQAANRLDILCGRFVRPAEIDLPSKRVTHDAMR